MASLASIVARRQAAREKQKLGDKNVDIPWGQAIDLQLIDGEDSLKHALKNYDMMYWSLSEGKGAFPSHEFHSTMQVSRLVHKPWTGKGRIPRDQILSTGCIQWCVSHAFSGHSNILGKLNGTINAQVLVAALLLTVDGLTYIVPPDFDDDTLADIFMILLGGATFLQLFNMIGYMVVANLVNEPYTPGTGMYARVEADFYLNFLSITVYVGILFMIGALFCVAWGGSATVLYVLAPICVVIFSFFGYILYDTKAKSYELKKEAVYQFYEAFCEPDGRLSDKYLDMAYADHENLISESEGEHDIKKQEV